MKVSVNWVKEYLQFDLPSVDELVKRVGSQLGEVEGVTNVGAKYQGALVVKVVECSKLENSDHLSLCFVDDGGVATNVSRRDDGLVQVVCGAPNVTAGATVVWLPPGATVPSTYDSDPFVLEARELRGTVSNGMLASPKELAMGDSHDGLLLIEEDIKPGTSLVEAFKLDDHIIDIENKMFTHRPDCFGQLGVAREVAGILGQQFTSPEWYTTPVPLTSSSALEVEVTNEIPELCPRYMAVAIDNITIGPSPVWLQTYLSRVGIRPINNIVDLTNYIMVLTGQPMHAFDFDKIAIDGKAQIVVRNPKKDEELTLLDAKTILPRADAILIATPDKPIALGGVMGGGNSEIDEHTKRIVIECANFDMYNIRRTSMQHGIFTDAVTRYNKGQSEWQCEAVLAQTVALLQQWYPDGPAVGAIVDFHQSQRQNKSVQVNSAFVNARLGLQLSAEEMATLLTNVECTVQVNGDELQVMAPFWRTDIEIREDVVEEIGRLYGFDKLPHELPQRDITPATQDALLAQKTTIRNSLAGAGANEVLTYSFVHGNLLDKAGQNREQAFTLSNALSPDLQYYRLSALPSLLDKVHANIKSGYNQFALFELSKAHGAQHVDESGLPVEFEDLDFVYASKQKQPGAAFYVARRYVDALAYDLGVPVTYQPFTDNPNDPITDPYDLTRSARVIVDGQVIGVVGEFKPSVRKGFKLPLYCAGFSVSQRQLLQSRSSTASRYHELPRFPKIEQDICLRVSQSTPFADLHDVVVSVLHDTKPDNTTCTVSPLDIYQPDEAADYKQITFRIGLASFERTMTDQEMTILLQGIADKAHETYKAERV